MRVTGVGHAGLFIETTAGSVLCDPWVNPAFFGSWFPFPDNSDLDWEALGQADYLYVSHLHRDHFDAELLRRHVRKDTTVLLPDYPTDELERELATVPGRRPHRDPQPERCSPAGHRAAPRLRRRARVPHCRLSTSADLVAINLARREVDWSNRRTSGWTAGTCSAAAHTCAPTWPNSALLRTTSVADDGVLTWALHGWRFDLAEGRCLTAAGHPICATPLPGG